MFGYIKPCNPELKVKDMDLFKAVYCGLCLQLGKSFGFLARLTLNYDFVFLAMLRYSQEKTMPEIYRGRCPVNPLNKVLLCKSDDSLVYSADIAAIMVYYNLIDNIEDSGFFGTLGWSIFRPYASHIYKKAVARQPKAGELVREMMVAQRKIEEQKSPSVDAASEPTARTLSRLAEALANKEEDKPLLARLGYLVGRYIYLCDAMDDLEKDLKTGNYNPFVYRCLQEKSDKQGVEKTLNYAKDTLQFTVSEIAVVCEAIEFNEFAPILENIVQFGMIGGIRQILSKEGRKNNEQSL